MDFYKRVRMVCLSIPYGTIASYGQVALLCGKPKNARQVGYALSRRLTGNDIPAHRMTNSTGYLSGAAAFDYPDLQKRLLEEEGVEVSAENQVNIKKFGWKHTYEDALAFRAAFEKEGI